MTDRIEFDESVKKLLLALFMLYYLTHTSQILEPQKSYLESLDKKVNI